MRLMHVGAFGALFFLIAPSGCATVIGLDNGVPLAEDGGGADPDSGSSDGNNDDASAQTDSGGGLVCTANTADCNGQANDGCETPLGTPTHCASCTDACLPGEGCFASKCCTNQNQACALNSDCCSNNCHNLKCDKPGSG